MRPLLLLVILVLPALSGCAGLQDLWNQATRPDYDVERTPLSEREWNQDGRFLVMVDESAPRAVIITARSDSGETLTAEGLSQTDEPVLLDLPDGTWTVSYTIDGHAWETFHDVQVDSTPPAISGLELTGVAENGIYVVGADAMVEPGAQIIIYRDEAIVGRALPFEIRVAEGLTSLQVIATDAAGNEAIHPVQIRSGNAEFLPPGSWDFGIVARYTNQARAWDLTDLDAYLLPADSAAEAGGWMGAGYGVTPDDPAVQDVVAEVVAPGDSSARIAWDLYQWMFDHLEYDDERLVSTTLMLPSQVLLDTEDPDAEASSSQDAGDDGLADPGVGNGVAGGVCRDLAGTYVSLLRAAGVPARLVSGYLAGGVDGFHAWVEVYVGDIQGNPGPWMPVDISAMDGTWGEDRGGLPLGPQTAMTSFGIALPAYLALRQVPSPEAAGWSTAIGIQYTYDSSGAPPDIAFRKNVVQQAESTDGKLCFDVDTRSRTILTSGDCSGTYFPFVAFTQRTIDYGIEVVDAGAANRVEAAVAYPFASAVAPDHVEYNVYGRSYTTDAAAGTVAASFRP